jgi:hypothetical protein
LPVRCMGLFGVTRYAVNNMEPKDTSMLPHPTPQLTECPACQHKVSVVASSCPQCGHPLQTEAPRPKGSGAPITMVVGLLTAIGGYALTAAPYANVFHLFLGRAILWGGMILSVVGFLIWVLRRRCPILGIPSLAS